MYITCVNFLFALTKPLPKCSLFLNSSTHKFVFINFSKIDFAVRENTFPHLMKAGKGNKQFEFCHYFNRLCILATQSSLRNHFFFSYLASNQKLKNKTTSIVKFIRYTHSLINENWKRTELSKILYFCYCTLPLVDSKRTRQSCLQFNALSPIKSHQIKRRWFTCF